VTSGERRPAFRLRQPPELLWAGCVAAQVAIAALLTSYTYFFVDDFLFLGQGRTQGFGLAYLREQLFEHFSPVTRVLNKLVLQFESGGFGFAHGVQLALYAAAIVAFALVARSILGRSWTAFALTVLFGQSVFLLRLLNWWTATANLLPATIFVLLSLAAYLRWHLHHDRRWLAASLLAYCGALLDYETAMLFPVYLLTIRLLILDDDLRPRSWARTLWRERWTWIAYGVLAGAALVNYYESYYAKMASPTAIQVAQFLKASLFQAFIPALFGLKRATQPSTVVVLLFVLAFCAAAAATIYARPRAWRALVAALIAFLVTMLPLGLNRIHLFGVDIGTELYYQQSAQFMFLVFAAFALSRRWGGVREHRPRLRIRAPVLVPAAVAAAAAYGVLYVTSVHSLAKTSWEPRATRAYFHQLLASVDRVRAATGSEPNVIDQPVPEQLMLSVYAPYNLDSTFVGVIDPHLRYDHPAGPTYVVGPSGALERVRFVPLASERPGAATLHTVTGKPAGRPATDAGATCVPSGPARQLRFPLTHARRGPAQTGTAPYAVRVHYRMPARGGVSVVGSDRPGTPPVLATTGLWGSGRATALAVLGKPAAVRRVDLDLPGGACVDQLTLGAYEPAG
jgi:hypothetical protein